MKENESYWIVANNRQGVIVQRLQLGLIRVTGRDTVRFLQGQLTNDVTSAVKFQAQHSSILNNTGHILADIQLTILEDSVLLATDLERVKVLRDSLERFVVRERVEFDDISEQYALITVQGIASSDAVDQTSAQYPNQVTSISNPRYGVRTGFDLLVQKVNSDGISRHLLNQHDAHELNHDKAEILRVEAGIPAWPNELNESVIPLEAGFSDAISYTKGCYMGQEIIARIHSRGHTNRTLVGLRFDSGSHSPQLPSSISIATDDSGQREIGRVTTIVQSPRFGTIGLGYVRNEFAEAGRKLATNSIDTWVVIPPFEVESTDLN